MMFEERNAAFNVGVGLRRQHYERILEDHPRISFFEAISENFMCLKEKFGGRVLKTLADVRSHYPIVLHGVSLSIGSADAVDFAYLARLKELIEFAEPAWVSDHLCWTGVNGENLHDLLPLPYTEETLAHVTRKISQAQDFLGRRMAFENVSAYFTYTHSEMTEWEFLRELARRADCDLLVDINNIYVSSVNLAFDPLEFVRALPPQRIAQLHLAGHSRSTDGLHGELLDGLLIDTHDHPVPEPVWDLYREATRIWGPVPTLIEWDEQIPELDLLMDEAYRAERIQSGLKRHLGERVDVEFA